QYHILITALPTPTWVGVGRALTGCWEVNDDTPVAWRGLVEKGSILQIFIKKIYFCNHKRVS
ncbi:MAG: hypothetical protein IJR04_00290, partial [Bacteroidales bacterium]|nr:hypothetical protein [Bacteroidales bacterium]